MLSERLYIANDVEAAGPRLGVHSMLSFGACIVPHTAMPFSEMAQLGMVFYAELKPISLAFKEEAMRVGCLHLKCLDEIRHRDRSYDPTHPSFQPARVLELMQDVCEEPADAAERFVRWTRPYRESCRLVGITDTVFFDSGHINLWLGTADVPSPYGHSGLDLDSVYRGYSRHAHANLGSLRVPEPMLAHRADHDAHQLAERARVLLLGMMSW